MGGTRMDTAATVLSSVEELVQHGAAQLKQGEDLDKRAESGLLSSADPLAAQPQEPKSWTEISASLQRAKSKMTAVRGRLLEAKQLARRRGISLISVGKGQTTPIPDAYG